MNNKLKKEIEKNIRPKQKINQYNKFHVQITKTERKTKKHYNKEMPIAFLKQFAQKNCDEYKNKMEVGLGIGALCTHVRRGVTHPPLAAGGVRPRTGMRLE